MVRLHLLCFDLNFFRKSMFSAAAAAVLMQAMPGLTKPASAQVVRDDSPVSHGMTSLPNIPISVWRDPDVQPRAIAIAVHGMVMHGTVYDCLARELVPQGFEVYAQDMRGYGRWRTGAAAAADNKTADNKTADNKTAEKNTNDKNKKSKTVSYKDSLEDLKALIVAARTEHPDLPIFLIGESMGAGLSLRAAEAMPTEISGLVLSSPALKQRTYLEPEMVKDVASLITNPVRQVNLVPYIKKFASEDPQVVAETIEDPLVRKTLTIAEILTTASVIRNNMHHAKNIPADIPVLVIQGDQDRMLKQNAVVLLLKKLKCTDQNVRWLPGKGHVLLETAHIDSITLGTVKSWLADHLPRGTERLAKLTSKAKYHESDLVEISTTTQY